MRIFIGLMLLVVAACDKAPAPDAAKSKAAAPTAAQVQAEAGKLKLQPGEWTTTTRVTALTIGGIDPSATKAALGTPTTTRNCVTPAQAARPDAGFLSGTAGANCSFDRFSMADARIDAAMTCKPPGTGGAVPMAMTLTGGYSPVAFDMGLRMNTELPGTQGMTMAATVTGRRVGPCTATTQEGAAL